MMQYNALAYCKSVLCLNGNLPDKNFFDKLDNKPIIAADGAANQLLMMGVNPAVILGDLDSLNQKNKFNNETKIIYLSDQNKTDFEKSLEYLKEKKLLPTMVCGVNGGFIDHILNNINIIMSNNCMFYDHEIQGIVLKKGQELILSLKLGTKISLIGVNAKVKTQGLKWELDNMLLKFPGKNSCFNRNVSEDFAIRVSQGKILLLIYQNNEIDRGILE